MTAGIAVAQSLGCLGAFVPPRSRRRRLLHNGSTAFDGFTQCCDTRKQLNALAWFSRRSRPKQRSGRPGLSLHRGPGRGPKIDLHGRCGPTHAPSSWLVSFVCAECCGDHDQMPRMCLSFADGLLTQTFCLSFCSWSLLALAHTIDTNLPEGFCTPFLARSIQNAISDWHYPGIGA